jgi:hypothetical protein
MNSYLIFCKLSFFRLHILFHQFFFLRPAFLLLCQTLLKVSQVLQKLIVFVTAAHDRRFFTNFGQLGFQAEKIKTSCTLYNIIFT